MSGLNNALIKLKLVILSLSPFFPQLQFEVPLSPVIAAKKARPSDGGSDEVCEPPRWSPACLAEKPAQRAAQSPRNFTQSLLASDGSGEDLRGGTLLLQTQVTMKDFKW